MTNETLVNEDLKALQVSRNKSYGHNKGSFSFIFSSRRSCAKHHKGGSSDQLMIARWKIGHRFRLRTLGHRGSNTHRHQYAPYYTIATN